MKNQKTIDLAFEKFKIEIEKEIFSKLPLESKNLKNILKKHKKE